MIPVFQPTIGQEEIEAVVDALQKGEFSGSFGPSITSFERAFADFCGCKHGIAVTSGTTALQLAVQALDLPKGSEVLMSASTNIATGLAAVHNGLIPIGVDSEEETWNLDLTKLEDLITPKSRLIIPVHLFGHPVDMDRLMHIANKNNLPVIEDCAESHGALCRGRMTGSFGQMSCFSFYANKLITTGEGGMILTNCDLLAERLRLLRNLGFGKPRFLHKVIGHNFRMTAMQAAIGKVQVRRLPEIIEAKRRMAAIYSRELAGIPGIQLPKQADWAYHVYWMYGILVNPGFPLTRDALASELLEQGIETRTFFCPMNSQPCFLGLDGFREISAPVAEKLWNCGLYLPSTHSLAETEITRIAAAIRHSMAKL